MIRDSKTSRSCTGEILTPNVLRSIAFYFAAAGSVVWGGRKSGSVMERRA